MDVLVLDSIQKAYGPVKALKGVSLAIPEGTVYGILGPNGSGKTTLLSIILDVLAADKGSYSWFGKPGSKEQRKKIGSLLETPNFYHYLSAVNNLKITHTISGRGSLADIHDVLKKVNLYERRNSRFSTYSLGMKQRLAIAAALLGAPKVLVLDEPTNGLDPVGIAEIRDLIKLLRENGTTVIIASHLLDEVEKVCTHVAILKTGTLITQGTVEEVLADEDLLEIAAPDLEALKNQMARYPGIDSTETANGLLILKGPKGSINPAAINSYCHGAGISLTHLALRKKRLEARFFELTSN
ncbi:ABC transporter ATP-binding protein [Flavihumibacter sp. CACIAM 22H1]|uniref:ABC transporter ATP-binding protein n=1 Tax=Flavihumibacter sp. CACIAM 22H1 TaxID=1812911 RepID=UPI0007A8AFFD|nr:ABC transporter ATP-binding protein [Flavihumibacter sp. CACIAM 22H1]KYP16550.1 MAG: ABC transporter ATP-binding protein [Flavihumibacter sp. CACIAM 22H1]